MPPQFDPVLSVRFCTSIARGAAVCLALAGLSACTTTQPDQAQERPLMIARIVSAPAESAARTALAHDVRILRGLQMSQMPISSAEPDARDLAQAALTQLGIKYRYGGKTPTTGFDCSGLVVYAAEQSLGLTLPHHAATLARLGTEVKRQELRVGDLVFFNTRGRRFSHMGIYLGDHQFVHAPRKGAVVRVERMDKPYWQKRYNGARRLDSATLAGLASASATS